MANAEEQENQAHQVIAKEAYPTLQLDLRWKKMHCLENDENWERIWELRGCCLEQKEQRSSREKDPKTFQENSQGRDPNTLERNSQGEDPRTFEESVKKVKKLRRSGRKGTGRSSGMAQKVFGICEASNAIWYGIPFGLSILERLCFANQTTS